MYTKEPIQLLHQQSYSLRNQDVVGRIRARAETYLSSFYPNCIFEWNKLDPGIRLEHSVAVSKAKNLSKIRPLPSLSLAFMIQYSPEAQGGALPPVEGLYQTLPTFFRPVFGV